MASVGIIGGGVIGMFTAYYLQKEGFEVTVIDRGKLSEGCSYGNAGMIVPSHIIPLAAPGAVLKGLKWLLNKKSPFSIKPTWDKELLYWLYTFQRSATQAKVQVAIPQLAALSQFSKLLYQTVYASGDFPLELQEKGILMLCQSGKTEAEELKTARVANAQGIQAIPMSAAELADFDPTVRYTVKSAVYYPGDAIIDPAQTMGLLQKYLKSQGVTFLTDAEVSRLWISRNYVVSVQCRGDEIGFDHFVLCGGVWTGRLLENLDIRLPLLGGKGYSFMQANTRGLRIPSLLLDHKVSVTPFGPQIRFGGTMELGPFQPEVNRHKVKGIHEAISRYYPEWKSPPPQSPQVWHGLRPCSPDGLPYIGRVSRFSNLYVATGHGMMGVSLAPASGKLISGLVAGKVPHMELDLFRPERFQ